MNLYRVLPLFWKQRQLRLSAGKQPVVAFGGKQIAVRPFSYDFYVLAEVFWEQAYAPRAISIRRPGVVMDLGANIGAFSVWAAWRWLPERIIAVEMEAGSYTLLEANIRLNGLNGCVLPVKAAIWDKDGRVGIERHAFNHGMDRVCPGPGQAEVPAVTLETLMRQTGVMQVDLLKMDIEGAEAKLFNRENEPILAGAVGCVLAELHPTRGVPVKRIGATLRRIGFQVHIRPQPLRTTLMLEAVNLRLQRGGDVAFEPHLLYSKSNGGIGRQDNKSPCLKPKEFTLDVLPRRPGFREDFPLEQSEENGGQL